MLPQATFSLLACHFSHVRRQRKGERMAEAKPSMHSASYGANEGQRRGPRSGLEMRISVTPERLVAANALKLSDGLIRDGPYAGLTDSPHSPVDFSLEEQISVTYVESPSVFWAQCTDNDTVAAVEKMSNDLQIFCKNKPLLQSPPIINKVYGGIFSEDGLWYRARIREVIDSEQVYVQFVDYGNSEVVRMRSIVCLSMDLLNVPQFAQLYRLEGVLPPSDATSNAFKKGVEYLFERTSEKVLASKARFKRKSPSKALPVELIGDNGKSIGEEMLKEGLVMNSKPHYSSACSSPQSTDLNSNTFELATLKETVETQKKLLEKYKEMLDKQLEFAVSKKFKRLLQKVKQLRLLRAKVSCEPGSSSDPIVSSIELIRDDKKNVCLDKMELLGKVKDAEHKLNEAQDKIRTCNDKNFLTELTVTRNKARQEFYAATSKFLSHAKDLPLDMRSMELELRLTEICQHDVYTHSGSVEHSYSSVVTAREALTRYEEWKKRSEEKVAEVRSKTDSLCQEFGEMIFCIKEEICSCGGESNSKDQINVADMDSLIARVEESLKEEMNATRPVTVLTGQEALYQETAQADIEQEDDEEGFEITAAAGTALRYLIASELDDIKLLREKLIGKYSNILNDLEPWLSNEPDLTAVLAVRKELKSLKSKLRHLLADRADLMEGEDPEDADRLTKVEEEIKAVQRKMHPCFSKEHNHLRALADLASGHFPELPLKYQDLAITTFLETNGVVKAGRELDHYPGSVSDWHAELKTEFLGKMCLLKEVSLDGSSSSRESFLSRVKEYNRVLHPRLRKLEAVFFDKTRRNAYLQVGYYMKIEEWMRDQGKVSPKDLAIVMRDILEALCVLHVAGIVHGSVSLDSVLVVKSKNHILRGILAEYDCSRDMCQRIAQTSPSQKPLTVVDEAQSFDMSCFGQILAQVNIPGCEIPVSDTGKLKAMSADKNLLSVLEGLLTKDRALTALQALKTPYFTDCVAGVVLIDDEEESNEVLKEDNQSLPSSDAQVNGSASSPTSSAVVENGLTVLSEKDLVVNQRGQEADVAVDNGQEELEEFFVDSSSEPMEKKSKAFPSGDGDSDVDSGPPPLDDA